MKYIPCMLISFILYKVGHVHGRRLAVDYVEPHDVEPIEMSEAFYLTQDMKRWRQGYDDTDTSRNTYLDFETKSHAVRINAEYPIEIPSEFTVCGQYKSTTWIPPWGGRIGLIQIGTTSHGQTVIQDFLNPNMGGVGIVLENYNIFFLTLPFLYEYIQHV